jgi:hypothetical protein
VILQSCDTCGSAVLVKVYRDKATNASFRGCWRSRHRRMARTALARRVAQLNVRLR